MSGIWHPSLSREELVLHTLSFSLSLSLSLNSKGCSVPLELELELEFARLERMHLDEVVGWLHELC